MKKQIKVSFLLTLYATIGLGIIYPVALSLIGSLVPSSPAAILKQPILQEDLFQGRPSMSGGLYSGASNLALTSAELDKQVGERIKHLSKDNPGALIPRDLLFASASGYDPDISLEGARFQIPRIAKARNIERGVLEKLVEYHIQRKLLGFIGTDKLNVVRLNEALEKEPHND
jgi:K+-transporting ATPase ATPase C chain